MSSYQKGMKTGLGQMLEKADSFNRILESIDNKINSISNDIGGMGSNIDGSIRDISNNINNMTKAQNEYNAAVENSESSGSKLLGKVKQLAKSVFSLDNAKLAFNATIGGAAKAREQLIGFQSLMGDKEVGKEYLDKISKDSIQKGFSPDDAVNNTRGFMKVTKNTDKLDSLNNMAARLSITNPSKGVGDSGAAIQSAMSGKFDDLQNKFNFSEADTQILKGSKSLDDFIGKMDVLLNKKGLTAQNLVDFSESPLAQVNQLKNNIDDSLSSIGEGALDSLTGIILKINEAFSSQGAQSFFENIAIGLAIIANIGVEVFKAISNIGEIFNAVFPYMGAIILGIAVAYGIYWLMLNACAIATKVYAFVTQILSKVVAFATHAQNIFNAAMAFNPIQLVIGLVVGLIVALVALVAFCKPVRDGFAWAFKSIADICAYVFGVVVDVIEGTLNWIIDKINGILGGINTVTNAVASVFGGTGTNLHIDKVNLNKFKVDVQKDITSFGDKGASAIENFSADNLKGMIKGAIGMGDMKTPDQDVNKFNLNQIDNFKMPADKLPTQPSVPASNIENNFNTTNQKLDNINDSIDISNEHLEMLKDLAEIESVQNFVTLTPTVEVTTGDIKEEADINTIISKIENYMRTELVNSAEGVYV